MKNFKPNENFKYYMHFVEERMNIFWKRLEGQQQPYTDDPILREYKFTNVYRVLDRASQYLLSNVINNGKEYTKEEMFWRILIYKHFNLPSTWELLINEFGDIDSSVDLFDIADFLDKKIDEGVAIYSNAYMLTAAFLSGNKGEYCHLKENKWKKYRYYFYIFKKELIEKDKISDILNSKSFTEMFNKMSSVTSFGDFITYQYCQDLNYTDFFDFDDNEFCSAGVGTIRGIKRCFDIEGKVDYGEIVKWVHRNFEYFLDKFNSNFKPLPNHMPTVPDLSNCFCETDKYLRGLGLDKDKVKGKRIKNKFVKSNKDIDFVFPKKWNVGKLV